ncbi:penicillin-binding protein 2 [bacterium]|nr:MAG: penicillin-binding protein 2 [bacterium]
MFYNFCWHALLKQTSENCCSACYRYDGSRDSTVLPFSSRKDKLRLYEITGFIRVEKRILYATYFIIFIFAVFLFKLWDLQVIRGREFKEIAEQNRLRIVEIPAPRGLIYDRNNRPLVKNIPSFDISVLKEDISRDPQTISDFENLLELDAGYIAKRLRRFPESPFAPVKLKMDVSMKEVARVEARKMDYPALQVEVVISREYIYDDFASHAIGYLGHLTFEQAGDPDYSGVPRMAFIGQMGVEKIHDKFLRGTAGKKYIEVDAMGRMIRVFSIQQPVKGDDIQLTIDMDLQRAAENALKDKTGAIVVIGVHNGEVLALASKPSFNPNLFSRGINYDDWERLVNDPRKPFLNRTIQSQYPPGSTFKPITALVALEEEIINENTKFYCRGSIEFGREFKCWKKQGHGLTDLHKALVESCDVYFYEIAKKLDIDSLSEYATHFGLGSPSGIELEGEISGIVPSARWKMKTKKQKWFKGESLNTVIGQGYLSTSPIQMARLMAALVNGGKLYRLHLLKNKTTSTPVESALNISPRNMELLKRALIGVVSEEEGTGKKAFSDIVSIGGKTGTTQVIGGDGENKNIPERFRDHAWFIAFAPEENPQIALSVFVEHGGQGSTAAAPMAKKVIETYFKEKDSRIQGIKDSSELRTNN